MDGAKDPPAEHQVASDVWSLILNNLSNYRIAEGVPGPGIR